MKQHIVNFALSLIMVAVSCAAYAWHQDLLNPAETIDAHIEISEKLRPIHEDRRSYSQWPDPVSSFGAKQGAKIDVWPKRDSINLNFDYQEKPAKLELRGEFMINGRIYGTDLWHRSLQDLAPIDISFGFGMALRDDNAK